MGTVESELRMKVNMSGAHKEGQQQQHQDLPLPTVSFIP